MDEPYRITLVPGETVGPELMRQAEKVLRVLQECSGAQFILAHPIANSASVDLGGPPLPKASEKTAKESHAVLYGTLGANKYLSLARQDRPEYSLNVLRRELGVFCNLRRIFVPPALRDRCRLKGDPCFDILVIRDLSCGLSSANASRRSWTGPNGREAADEEHISEAAVARCGRLAFEMARLRGRKVTSLDKASLNDTSVLWREKMQELSREYPDVALVHEYIDTAAMAVIEDPKALDVVVTLGAYGDIFMDELTALSGIPSALGSAELAESGKGIYTPNMVHCPHEWMAGKGVIYPLCIMEALALLLEHSLERPDLAGAVRQAEEYAVSTRKYTQDIYRPGDILVSTDEVGDLVAARLRDILTEAGKEKGIA